jgi:hypothetical protein
VPARTPADHIPHVIKLRPLLPLLTSLHELNSLNRRGVKLKPDLDANPRNLPAQQESGIDATTADIDQHASKRLLAVLPAHLHDIANPNRIAIVPREKLGARARGVESADLQLRKRGQRVFGRRGERRVDPDAAAREVLGACAFEGSDNNAAH